MLAGRLVSVEDEEELFGFAPAAAAAAIAALRRSMRAFFVEAGGGVSPPPDACGDAVWSPASAASLAGQGLRSPWISVDAPAPQDNLSRCSKTARQPLSRCTSPSV